MATNEQNGVRYIRQQGNLVNKFTKNLNFRTDTVLIEYLAESGLCTVTGW